MKLEVDLNDRAQLLALEKELTRSLEIVKGALATHNSNPTASPTPSMADNSVENIITRFSGRFTSSDVYNIGTGAGMARKDLKSALARLVAERVIKVIVAGKGRRPTEYEKA